MRRFGRTFLKGLAVVLPLMVTIYVVHWFATTAESTLGPLVRRWLPDFMHIPGLGIVICVAGILVVGVLIDMWLTRRILRVVERLLARIPLVKTLYGSVRDLMGFLARDGDENQVQQVVVVTLNDATRILGFVTRNDLEEIPEAVSREEVAVYLPMSYQIGGFTVFVPRTAVTPVDMSVEDGLRFAMTAAISGEHADAEAEEE